MRILFVILFFVLCFGAVNAQDSLSNEEKEIVNLFKQINFMETTIKQIQDSSAAQIQKIKNEIIFTFGKIEYIQEKYKIDIYELEKKIKPKQ